MSYYLVSNDVIHAFFLPHIWDKCDMLPGVISFMNTVFPIDGLYKVQCAQICGLNHHSMNCFLLI